MEQNKGKKDKDNSQPRWIIPGLLHTYPGLRRDFLILLVLVIILGILRATSGC